MGGVWQKSARAGHSSTSLKVIGKKEEQEGQEEQDGEMNYGCSSKDRLAERKQF